MKRKPDLNEILALPDEALINGDAAAAVLDMAPRSLERHRRERLLPYVSLGRTCVRYRLGDLRKMIRERTIKAEAA